VPDATVVPTASLQLHGGQPNPFNPSTTLRFTLGRPMTVALDIVDVRGRLVRHLQAGELSAGDHAARWDGRDDSGAAVAGGVYLAQLKGKGASALAKLLLVK
jgi:hypothetical protein